MSRALAVSLALAVTLAGPVPVGAQPTEEPEVEAADADGPAVTIQAVRDDLDEATVQFVAQNAQYTVYNPSTLPNLTNMTGKQVAELRCGTSTVAYAHAFEDLNGKPRGSFPEKTLVPDYSLHWPACFNVVRGDFTAIVAPNRLPETIYKEATGSPGLPQTHQHFFAASGVKNLAAVQPGQVLKFGFKTFPVSVVPLGSKEDFITDLKKVASASPLNAHASEKFSANLVTTKPKDPPVDGEIVVGSIAADTLKPPECDGIMAAPFDLERVAAAHLFDKDNATNTVSVLVVDNGFYGAERDTKITARAAFDKREFHTFDEDGNGRPTIGPTMTSGTLNLTPFNRELNPPVTPDEVSGHGTHIAGLVLGGPARGDDRFFTKASTDPFWLQMTVMTMSPGTRLVPRQPLSGLRGALDRMHAYQPNIMNISLKFGLSAREDLTATVEHLPDTLFVTAAGNEGANLDAGVSNAFPAALGARTNVVTVASEDGRGNLTNYTNKSSTVVDLAAPGCNLLSSLDGDTEVRVSGTSQAAPAVTFAAALLGRHGLAAPARQKRRLLLSGDLITGAIVADADGKLVTKPVRTDTPVGVRSRSRLNLAKALYFHWDYLRYRDEADVVHEVLGTVDSVTGPPCGDPDHAFRNVLAFKRSPVDHQVWCFWKSDDLKPVLATPTAGDNLDFTAAFEIDGAGVPQPIQRTVPGLPLSRVDEFVLSEAAMNNNS